MCILLTAEDAEGRRGNDPVVRCEPTTNNRQPATLFHSQIAQPGLRPEPKPTHTKAQSHREKTVAGYFTLGDLGGFV